MTSTQFWKLATVAALVGLFYVGHGLHEQQSTEWGLISSASASEALLPQQAPSGDSWASLHDGESQNWVISARRRVPGGWLVAVRESGITFYPDPNHEWAIPK